LSRGFDAEELVLNGESVPVKLSDADRDDLVWLHHAEGTPTVTETVTRRRIDGSRNPH